MASRSSKRIHSDFEQIQRIGKKAEKFNDIFNKEITSLKDTFIQAREREQSLIQHM